MPPPSPPAILFEIVLSRTLNDAPTKLSMAPAALFDVLSEIVPSLIARVPSFSIPPPMNAELPEMLLFLSVNAPELRMPPPCEVPLTDPPVTVTPSRVRLAPAPTLKARSPRPEALMMVWPAPAPWMTRLSGRLLLRFPTYRPPVEPLLVPSDGIVKL